MAMIVNRFRGLESMLENRREGMKGESTACCD